MPDIDFLWSGPPLIERDIEEVESKIGRALPANLKRLYLQHNGGRPTRRCFFDDEGGEHAIHEFLIMKHRRSQATRLFEESYENLERKSLLPAHGIPIAVNEGGDYFFLNDETGEVYFYAMDYVDQPDRATRHIASSLTEFLGKMISDEEMFG